jgi:hypothetical protein
MAHTAPAQTKIPTENPQLARGKAARSAAVKPRKPGGARRSALTDGVGRASARDEDRVVIELENGITVYPARDADPRWRAVWYEGESRKHTGTQRRLCQRFIAPPGASAARGRLRETDTAARADPSEGQSPAVGSAGAERRSPHDQPA